MRIFLSNSWIANACSVKESKKEERKVSISDEDKMELFTDKDEEDNNIN